jgi:hypothetical protein
MCGGALVVAMHSLHPVSYCEQCGHVPTAIPFTTDRDPGDETDEKDYWGI